MDRNAIIFLSSIGLSSSNIMKILDYSIEKNLALNEFLNLEENQYKPLLKKVTFDKVLVISDNGIKVGKPYLEGAKVEGKVLLQAKDKKVVVYKYKAKKNQRSKKGHRQPFSLVEIENIG